MKRQELLAAPDPPRVWAILDEAALRRPAAGTPVMRGQVRRLLEATEMPAVTLQVLPFAAGGHDAGGTFTILRFTERGIPDVVYVEQLTGATYVDKPDALDYHRDVMNRLASDALARPPRRASWPGCSVRCSRRLSARDGRPEARPDEK